MEGGRKPMLMYFTGKTLGNQTFCSISDPSKSYSTWNPEFRRSKLLTVQHGWFLWENIISKSISTLFLWNPYNLNKIVLQPLEHNGADFGNCILSSPPSNNQTCSLYLFAKHSPSIFYYQLGDKQWTKVCFYNEIVRVLAMQRKAPLDESMSYFDNPVYCNGSFYAGMMILSDYIMVVIQNLQPNGFTINCTHDRMIKQLPTGFEQLISRLIACNNELFRIEIFYDLGKVTAVCVFKFDCFQRAWEKVKSIKDKVFFISSLDPSFVCQAINQETEGGRIYIALGTSNFVYIYNIQDNCIVTRQPFSNLSSKRLSYSRWVMPNTWMADSFKQEIGEFHQSICDVEHLKDGENEAHNGFLLSLDAVEVIAKHINNVLDYLNFRATNKFFRLAAPQIQWRSSSSMSRFDDRFTCPLLVFSEDAVFTFVNPKHGLKYKYMINFRQCWNFNSEICCSKDGWLLLGALKNSKGFQGFFNPFTKQVIPLPFWDIEIKNTRCVGMSHSPTSNECVVVELDKIFFFSPITTAFVHLLGDKFSGHFTFEDCKFPVCNVSPVFHNGSFYFLSVRGKLAVLQVTRENYSWKELQEPQTPCSSYFNSFLVECDGNLLAVFESTIAKGGIQVFKLNESTMTWIKLQNLKNHMIFVGKTSFSAVATVPGMENKIYFSRFYEHSLVFYSLQTNNYHTFQHDQVVNFHHMRQHLNGSWIQPRWH
ncbi:unnamed protein product [Lathyrus sativus]|nr:unnamed protein product [Lathyrus sativus]